MCPHQDALSGFSWPPFGNHRHDQEVECPCYIEDGTGTHVGCHFDEAMETQRTDAYFFWVNGTSNETAIQFADFTPLKAIQIGTPASPHAPGPRGGTSRLPKVLFLPGLGGAAGWVPRRLGRKPGSTFGVRGTYGVGVRGVTALRWGATRRRVYGRHTQKMSRARVTLCGDGVEIS